MCQDSVVAGSGLEPDDTDASLLCVSASPTVLPCGGYPLFIDGSSNIFVYGAGLYSFFKSWSTGCTSCGLKPNGTLRGCFQCQQNGAFVSDSSDNIVVRGLNTLGIASMLSGDGGPEAYTDAVNNRGPFTASVIARVAGA